MAPGPQREPFTPPRVLFWIIGTMVLPSVCLAALGILGLMEAEVRATPYVLLMIIALASIAVGTVRVARDAWKGARLARLKTDFVSHVSHELRTPLTSIRLFIETLQMDRARTPEERQACLDLLATETARLTEMIERMLEWSRIESGRKVLRASSLRVADLVSDAVAAHQAQTLKEPGLFAFDIPGTLPEVWADRGAVIDVLLNLVSNAYKYTGPVKDIRIVARHLGRWVTVAVEDNGPGVRRPDRKRIFEQFYRADHLLSRVTEGTGLGLAIAKRLALGVGGNLTYEPREGGGSRFLLKLPVARPRRPEEAREAVAAAPRP